VVSVELVGSGKGLGSNLFGDAPTSNRASTEFDLKPLVRGFLNILGPPVEQSTLVTFEDGSTQLRLRGLPSSGDTFNQAMLFLPGVLPKAKVPVGTGSNSGAPVESLLRANSKRINTGSYNTVQKGALGELRTSLTMRRAGFNELPARLPGNRGFDGVFVKNGANGSITDIVITESKFATNGVRQLTQNRTTGRQLSPQWINANIQRMLNSSDPSIVRTGMTLDANRSLIRARAAVTNANGVQRFSLP